MKQEYDVIDDETKISVVAGFALNDGTNAICETFIPVVLTKTEHLASEQCAIGVHINHQPSSAYKLLAEYLRIMADDLEKEARTRNEQG